MLFLLAVVNVPAGENLFRAEATPAYAKSWFSNPTYGPFGKLVEGNSGSPEVEFSFPSGWYRITGGDFIAVDPLTTYRLSMALQVPGQDARRVRIGLICYDKNKKMIDVFDTAGKSDRLFKLAGPVAVGDKHVTLNAKIRYQHHCALAFNALADGSDMPNRDQAPLKYSSKPRFGDVLELKSAAVKAYPAGTAVRIHPRREAILRDCEVESSIKKITLRTTGSRMLRPGTAFVKPYIMTSWKQPGTLRIGKVSVDVVPSK